MSYKPMWSSSRNQLTHFPWIRRNVPFTRVLKRALKNCKFDIRYQIPYRLPSQVQPRSISTL